MHRRAEVPGLALTGFFAALCAGCNPAATPGDNADVIVVGAGIAGLSAALEAEANGAHVLLIESNSVGGGHAVNAGGFALADTALQRAKGLQDSPDIAYRDLMAWGEDADPQWTRAYAEGSSHEVYDWLTGLGVKFTAVLDTPEDTVPRFHFTRGTAVHVIVPMMMAALLRPRIEFLWNTEVTEIIRKDAVITGVRTRRLRGGAMRIYRAPAVVLATGGFESNLELVRKSWRASLPPPERLLIGAGQNATGSGLRLAEALGAALTRMDHQEIFVSGMPDPRDPGGDRGLQAQNPAAIWVDSTGRRFTNEDAPGKVSERTLLAKTPATYWLIFDGRGEKSMSFSGAAWLSTTTIEKEILANPAIVKHADSVAGLAAAAGLPPEALLDTVARFNGFVEQKMDTDFGRIGPGTPNSNLLPIREPPFYALQLFPMSRKSMGGVAIDAQGRALGSDGKPVPGLFACGEVTGVAGINGSYGGSGTFLGPSVLTGRTAGLSAITFVHPRLPGSAETATISPAAAAGKESARPAAAPVEPSNSKAPGMTTQGMTTFKAGVLNILLKQTRPGYWHFEAAHRLVLERDAPCGSCHIGVWQPGPAMTREQRLVQLDACARCH